MLLRNEFAQACTNLFAEILPVKPADSQFLGHEITHCKFYESIHLFIIAGTFIRLAAFQSANAGPGQVEIPDRRSDPGRCRDQ
jgi:hypothetical protein